MVNIGTRQAGRERSTNVIDVPHDRRKIAAAVQTALSADFKEKAARCTNPYGDGRASERIVAILRKLEITDELIQKQITY